MCGTVGYVGHRSAVSVRLPGLRRLEYRGYDSAGIATTDGTSLEVRKSTGKIAELEARLAPGRPTGQLGIGHTRWAAHGHPSDANAHPHTDCHARIAIVHDDRSRVGLRALYWTAPPSSRTDSSHASLTTGVRYAAGWPSCARTRLQLG